LRARSKDAAADGLEDNDYAINSIEEYVDSESLEEAGHSGSMPAGEVSSKHTAVPTSLNKAQQSGIKPKALSLKKISSAQLSHQKHANTAEQNKK
jgi:hypothetical protein